MVQHPDARGEDRAGRSFPLSYGQRSLWVFERLHPETVANHLVFALNILSELDVPAFVRAAQLLVDRHPMLRTTFKESDGLPIQIVHDYQPVSFRVEPAEAWSDAKVSALVAAEAERPFDLHTGPLVRFLLLSRSPANHVWLVCTHHLLNDFWSSALMLHEMTSLYQAVVTGQSAGLRELKSGYEDFVERERVMVSGEEGQRHLAFWREYLDGAAPAVRLPPDLPNAPETDRGRESSLALDAETTSALKRLAAVRSATLHEVVLAGFLTLLHRYTAEGDLVIGTVAANRSARQARTVGCFMNSVGLRVDVSDSPSFSTVVDRVHSSMNARSSHTSYPFPKIAEELGLGAERPDRPYFSVMFSWDRTTSVIDPALSVSGAGAAEGIQSALHDLRVISVPLEERPAPSEILLRAGEIGQQLHLTIDYKAELFTPDTIARMNAHLRTLLTGAVSDAGRGVGELELLTERERSELAGLAGGVESGRAASSVVAAIRDQVASTPDAAAVRFGNQSLSYAELDARANRLARHLRASGVGPGVLVGVWMERSVEMLVAVLATLRSGGALLPLDPGFPGERIRFMVTDSKAKVVVTDSQLLAGGELAAGVEYVCIDRDAERIGRQSSGELELVAAGEEVAYVIYTSGSTGRPKGVQVEHRNLANLVQAMVERPGVRSSDVLLSVTTLSFDISLLELLVPLVVGAEVVIVDSETATDGSALAAVLAESGATIMQSTPSRWWLLIEAGWRGDRRLKALCGGEAMTRELADQLLAGCGSVWNMYGPTETTIWSAVEEVREGEGPVPIGAPVANNRLYVLDANLQLLPIGVPGELVIGGSGVARGYLGRPELTAERFVADPFGSEPGARMYRTGDLVRRTRSGDLEFLGRIDQQVKVRGHRIEPGEIESVLARHPAIAQAVVTAYQHAPGDTRLAAYYTLTEPSVAAVAEELRSHLRATLPDYMVPSAYVALAAFPSTPNNKIDRAQLPAPDSTPTGTGEAPRPGLESQLARIWEDVLGTPGVGRDDDFFDLGGHSLLATQIVSRIREQRGVEVSVAAVFNHPTVRALAEVVAASATAASSPSALMTDARTEGRPRSPLSFSQERMWFLHQLRPDGSSYNMYGAVRVPGRLHPALLERAINQLVARHAPLRTAFVAREGTPQQVVIPELTVHLPVVDYRSEPPEDRVLKAERAIRRMGSKPFDLTSPPLFRFELYRLDEDEYVLAVCLHHIISDNWSFGVLARDLSALYQADVDDRSPDLPSLGMEHLDFVRWHRRWVSEGSTAAQLEYWKQQLTALPVTEIPPDRARPAVQTDRGATLTSAFPRGLVHAISRLCREERASPFMVMLAAFATLLHRYTGADDIVLGVPVANRNWLHSEDLIASFVNTIAIRIDLSGDPSFRELVGRVRHTSLEAFAHQDVPFERLVEELRPVRDPSRSPLFQVLFNVTNAPFTLPEFGGVRSEFLTVGRAAAQFDLSLSVDWTTTQTATAEYNTDLYDASTIEGLFSQYWTLLTGAVSDAGRGVGELELLTERERSELAGLAGGVESGRAASSVVAAIRDQVASTPDAAAVRFGNQSLSYAELDARANRLARHLRASGVGPGVLVGVWMERSVEMLVAVLATLRSGGALLPLDPGFPGERIRFMVTDSKAKVVVTDSQLLAGGELAAGVEYVCIDRDAERIGRQSSGELELVAAGEEVAYVIYTSGSTGRPKGVQVEHRNLANLVQAMVERPGVRSSDVLLSVTTLSFDISLLELLVPLVVGAEVVIVDSETATDGSALAAVLAESGATIMQSTPSRWWLLIEAGWRGDRRLKALCGGEAMTRELADQLLAGCGSVWNMYGPTETTIWSAVEEVREGEGPVPIGAPVANNRLYVLDANLQLLPIGVPGELVIGGSGVARGYLGRPELTAERFVADPFGSEPGARMYRTGDLVRRTRSGDLEFLGRIDQQVKVRGHRIEPGEIESVLARHPAIAQAVVTAYQHAPGDTRLAAYYTLTEPSVAAVAEELRSHLRATLPDYMVPSAYVALAAFPSTPNNKIDRAQLPAPDSTPTGTGEAPRPGLESQLARIWEDVLGTPGVSRDDDFFDLGGHSLLATRMFAEIEALTGHHPPLSVLFRAPTIARLATALQALRPGVADQRPQPEGERRAWTSLVPVQTGGERSPFFYVSPFLISALSFCQLGRHLGPDQPLYILQPQGMESDQPFHTSVEEMAAHYIAEMKQVQPRGPYWIGGHCAGSWVAFEMARQLQHRGEDVGLLVLVDSSPPGIVAPAINPYRYLAGRVADFWREGRLVDALRWQLRVAADRVLVGRLSRRGGTARRIARLRSVHAAAHRSYIGGTVRGDALLLRSSEYARLRSRDWDLDWSKLVTGELDTVVVPSTHAGLSIEAEPLARAIRGALDEAVDLAEAARWYPSRAAVG